MSAQRTDSELLDDFVRRRDQAAFALLVQRYAGLVYAAAVRQVGRSLAEDASQAVFLILAQKAAQLDGRTLAGWLVNTARYAALASQRMDLRRQRREQKAALMRQEAASGDDPSETADDEWGRLAPMLDEALARLSAADRSAVTLRYLQGKSVREVATAMNVTEAAAGKRATRAVRALRDYFARRGVTLSAEAVGSALAVHGVVDVPAAVLTKLTTASVGGAAASAGAGTIAKGTAALMITAKTKVAAVAASVLVLGAGAVIVATQLDVSEPAAAAQPTTAPAGEVTVITAVAGARPATQPFVPVDRPAETFTRFATPDGQPPTFTGRVEGLRDAATAEIGIISLRGTHWTSNANYQWEPVHDDGTFSIAATKYFDARRAIAVRTRGQSVTFLRAEFQPGESGRDIVIRMKPTRRISIAATDSTGMPLNSFKAEIFDASPGIDFLKDDAGRRLSPQRLDAPVTSRGMIDVDVPLEPLGVMMSGTGVAPYFCTIDPRTSDRFVFSLLRATPLELTLLNDGKPLANERVMLHNPAVTFSYTARTTDADGRLRLAAGIPGTYEVEVRDRTFEAKLTEGEPCTMTVDLAKLPSPTTQP